MSEELTLLPCPACDSPVKLTGGDSWHNLHEFWIACKNRECGCCRVGDTVRDECIKRWNALPRALTWTDEPQLGAWNWWRDENSRIPRYVYKDGTVAIAMQIDRVPYQDLGGQWCPIPEPREPKE